MNRVITILILTVLFAAGQAAHAAEPRIPDRQYVFAAGQAAHAEPRIPDRQYVFGQPLPPGCKMATDFKGTYPQAYFVTENPKLEVVCTIGWLKNLAEFWHWLQALTTPEVLPNRP